MYKMSQNLQRLGFLMNMSKCSNKSTFNQFSSFFKNQKQELNAQQFRGLAKRYMSDFLFAVSQASFQRHAKLKRVIERNFCRCYFCLHNSFMESEEMYYLDMYQNR